MEVAEQIVKEKWLRGVAVTTTVLAVLTSIVTARFNNNTAQTQLLTTEEAMKWQYYQAKSIRLQLTEVKKNIHEDQRLSATAPEILKAIDERLAGYDKDMVRFYQQKEDLEKEAKELGKQKKRVNRQGGQYMIGVVLFQIAIMLSSVSALLQKKALWIVGLVFGVVACVYFANGFFLFF